MSDNLPIVSPPFFVAGNLATDLIVRGVERLPGWGEEVAGTGHTFVPSGQATFLAQALRAQGEDTRVVGLLGGDHPGERILGALEDCGANTSQVEVGEGQTAISVAAVRPDGERCFISDFAGLETFDVLFLERALARAEGTICLVGLLNLPRLDLLSIRRVLAGLRARGAAVVLDTGWDPGGWAPGTVEAILALLGEVDLFLPNRAEAEVLSRREDPKAMALALAEHCAGTVVIKLGPDGCLGFRDGRMTEAGGYRADVVDTVGAGDCFNAGLLHALGEGNEFEAALRWANATASIYVSRSKDRQPSADQVAAFLAANSDSKRKAEVPG